VALEAEGEVFAIGAEGNVVCYYGGSGVCGFGGPGQVLDALYIDCLGHGEGVGLDGRYSIRLGDEELRAKYRE